MTMMKMELIHLILLYGETVMTILHIWILIGYALPSMQDILQQPQWMTNLYILSDLTLPILVTGTTHTLYQQQQQQQQEQKAEEPKLRTFPFFMITLLLLITAHSILYLIFLYDNKQMIPVMEWAYSDWIQRRKQLFNTLGDGGGGGEGIVACLAVVLDTACHSWGAYTLLQQQQQQQQQGVKNNNNNNDNKDTITTEKQKLIAVSIGVIVAGVTIALLGIGQT